MWEEKKIVQGQDISVLHDKNFLEIVTQFILPTLNFVLRQTSSWHAYRLASYN